MRGGEVWARRDARSVDHAVTTLIADPEVDVVVGEIDGTPVGVGVMVWVAVGCGVVGAMFAMIASTSM